MRAMPNLRVIRPADANETAQAWRIAVDRDGPTALVLTRQGLPVLEGTAGNEGVLQGGYVLVEADGDARARAHRHGQRGPRVRRGRAPARRRRGRHPGRLAAVVGAVRRAGRGVPRVGAAARACRASRSRPPAPSAGSATPTTRSPSTASAPRRPGKVALENLGFTPANVVVRARGTAHQDRWSITDDRHDQLQRLFTRTGPEPVARQPQARLPHQRRARAAGRARHPRHHVEPHHLPEGDLRGRATTTTSSRR